MTTPVSILVYFGLEYSSGTIAVYDDPVKGKYDDPTYLYGSSDGDGVEIATDAFYVRVERGRSREIDEFVTGTATVVLRNFDRVYDPLNAASPYVGDITPGKRVAIALHGRTVFTGVIEDWNVKWDVNGDAEAEFTALDALGQLAAIDFDAWTTTAQASGARISAILDRSEVAFPASRRDIDAGSSDLQADSATWGSNVLNYAQLVRQSEFGWLFASVDDLVTFRGRHALVGANVGLTFADDGSGVAFHGIETQVGSELLFNHVGVDRLNGTLQTVEDATSAAAYGVRDLSITGLLLNSDAQSLSMAQFLASIYKDPTPRVAAVMVKVHDIQHLTVSQQETVAGQEIGNLVDVVWTPVSVGSPIAQVPLVVEGIRHEATIDTHEVLLQVAPSTQSGVAIYDDPFWGLYEGPGVYSF